MGHFRLYLINSTKVNSLKVAKFGSMDIVELHGDILQPGGQLETPGLVAFTSVVDFVSSRIKLFLNDVVLYNIKSYLHILTFC